MVNQDNIKMHEIIGYPVEIISASDKSLIGIKGRTIDETMKTVKIQRSEIEDTQIKKEIIVQKKNTVMKLTISSDNEIELDCTKIIYRPEDRIKKLYRKQNKIQI